MIFSSAEANGLFYLPLFSRDGPGLMAALTGHDVGSIGTGSLAGATHGEQRLWLLLV